MKKCGYCGRQNAEDARYCYECGTSFYPEEETGQTDEAKSLFGFVTRPISPWVKWGLYFAAWGAVVLRTSFSNPTYLRLSGAFAFPMGLLGIMPAKIAVIAAWWIGLVAVIEGWLIYAVFTFVLGKARRVGVFVLVYVLFCILLVLNVAGCEKLIETAGRIE